MGARLHLEGSKASHETISWAEAKATLLDLRLWGHYAIYFGVSTPFSSLSLFTPAITKGLGYYDLQAQLMTVPPYAVAYGKCWSPNGAPSPPTAMSAFFAVYFTLGLV